MGKPVSLLERLCAHVLSFDANSIEVRHIDRGQSVFSNIDGAEVRIANFPSSGADAKELLVNLKAAARKPVRAILAGKVHILTVRIFDSGGKDAFAVRIDPAPATDPSNPPPFTAKQGQYLAYIYNYTKIHRQAPAESDLERYFRVSPPAIHDMIKTLERNGLIERKPGKARSIRLLVSAEHLPRLE